MRIKAWYDPYWKRLLQRAEKKAEEYNQKMKEIEDKYSQFPQTFAYIDSKLSEMRQLDTISIKIAFLLAKAKKAKK